MEVNVVDHLEVIHPKVHNIIVTIVSIAINWGIWNITILSSQLVNMEEGCNLLSIMGHLILERIFMNKVSNLVGSLNKIYNKQDDPFKKNPLDLTSFPNSHFNSLWILYRIFNINHLLVERIRARVLPLWSVTARSWMHFNAYWFNGCLQIIASENSWAKLANIYLGVSICGLRFEDVKMLPLGAKFEIFLDPKCLKYIFTQKYLNLR